MQVLSQSEQRFQPLHISIIEVRGDSLYLPAFPGIADHHFITGETPGKGMISKREVRLSILSYMQASAGDVIWDIGAGCGGVSVELAYWAPASHVYALEYHPQRIQYLHHNQQRFGVVDNLQVVVGKAPAALADLPAPNKVFIGGSDGELPHLLQQVWQLLPSQGVLVVSGVIDKTKQYCHAFAQSLMPHQVESVELSVKRGQLRDDVSPARLEYQAKLPVEIFKFTKRENV
jgi:precorrin-6Y C5,15-methyltransferase (decarboxylating)